MDNLRTIRVLESELHIACRLAEIAGEESADSERLTDLLVDRRNIVLATLQEDTPVGYLVAHQFPSLSGDKLVYLYDIEVSPASRRLGIGTALVTKLKEVCREQGVESIWVGSSRSNHAACALWVSTGAERGSDQYVEFTYDL
jgi:ribosomal protein S18 acetylase RimI-like enzyme